MYHAYRSSRVVLQSGWRKSTMALLEPGDWTATVHVVPSGAVNVRMVAESWSCSSSARHAMAERSGGERFGLDFEWTRRAGLHDWQE